MMCTRAAMRLVAAAGTLRRVLLGAAAAVLLNSCGGGGGSPNDPSGGPIVGGPLDATSCAGADLSALTRMVYVSSLGADTDGCGMSSNSTCATIAKGIAACADSACGVLVRHGLYQTSATLRLRDGVNVYGSCRFDGEPDHRYRSVLQARPAAGTPAVLADSISHPTVFTGIVVVGKDETASGNASVAVVVKSSHGLTLSGTTIVAGTGGNAAAAASAQKPGGPGGDGRTGAAAIGSAGGSPGASCASNPPADSRGFGGSGGQSPFSAFDICRPVSGGPEAGHSSGDVAGGAAGVRGAAGLYCFGKVLFGPDDGGSGGNGIPGACGRPAQASELTAGRLASDNLGQVWLPSAGDDGRDGSVGSGGGGGGDGGACTLLNADNSIDDPGLPGGGGGGGGCGGAAGKGGLQGGASLALVVVDSTLMLDAAQNAVVPGPGGRGGDAGSAQAGGPGGRGGGQQTQGKLNFQFFACGGSGGGGGAGGHGGAGSAGAAGNGGPSIGLAFSGTTPPPSSTDGIYAPLPGAPGRGATGGAAVADACKGADGPDGQPGTGALAFSFDAANNPQASLLTAGTTLAPGQSRKSLDGKVEFLMQFDGNLCLYVTAIPTWCILNGSGGSATGVTMQTDGNLCVTYANGSKQCISSDSASRPAAGSYLQVRNDGHVIITDGTTVYWQSPASQLNVGSTLAPGQSRTSPDGKVELLMQFDGNLCLYFGGRATWCILNERQQPPVGATMQTDGNLCVAYTDGSKKCISQSAPLPPGGSYLQVRNDGHVVITDGAKVFWQAPS